MKKKITVISAIILAVIYLCPFLLNKYRISKYDDDMKHSRSFKTHCYMFPDKIPEAAINVYYNWNTLKFQLPEEEALILRAKIVSRGSVSGGDDHARPNVVTSAYKELFWDSSMLNHGTTDGVWYHPKKHEFIFYHDHW
jgi:hypothetical protein